MLLVDVTYFLNLGKVKVRVINMQALPIQCVLTLWIQIVVIVHVHCVRSHMYTTDCDITFLVFQCTLLQSSPLRRIQHIFCKYSQSLHAQLGLFPFIRYQQGWVYRGSIGWKRQPALWWDLLILNFMFFLISHNFHSYDCYSIMMTVMSRLWLCSESSVVLWYAVMKYCRRRILWQTCMSLKVI